MKINLECPVCRAKNELTLKGEKSCRRCKEDLSLLYQTKAYSYKYRLLFLQLLSNPQAMGQRQRLMYAASGLVKPMAGKVVAFQGRGVGVEEE